MKNRVIVCYLLVFFAFLSCSASYIQYEKGLSKVTIESNNDIYSGQWEFHYTNNQLNNVEGQYLKNKFEIQLNYLNKKVESIHIIQNGILERAYYYKYGLFDFKECLFYIDSDIIQDVWVKEKTYNNRIKRLIYVSNEDSNEIINENVYFYDEKQDLKSIVLNQNSKTFKFDYYSIYDNSRIVEFGADQNSKIKYHYYDEKIQKKEYYANEILSCTNFYKNQLLYKCINNIYGFEVSFYYSNSRIPEYISQTIMQYINSYMLRNYYPVIYHIDCDSGPIP